MLPDFRFILGAILATALLVVAGLGLVTSVQLVHEARMSPIEDARSLAFTGHAEWNQFYDPEAARRFDGLAGRTEGPVAQARLETPAETSVLASPVIAPPAITAAQEEQTADIPENRLDPDIPAVLDDDKTPDKTLEPDPAAATTTASTLAAPVAQAAGAPVPDVPGTTIAQPARVASAPATLPGPDLPREVQAGTRAETQTPMQEPMPAPAQPQAAGNLLRDSARPTPRARPKAHFRRKIARVHVRRVAPINPQTVQNSGFPISNTPSSWPSYDNQFTGATPKKKTGKLTGTLRPQ